MVVYFERNKTSFYRSDFTINTPNIACKDVIHLFS